MKPDTQADWKPVLIAFVVGLLMWTGIIEAWIHLK
jgi:hypothetical protein